MIPILSLVCIIGVFIAGNIFGVHTVAGITLLGVFVVSLGVLIAAAQTRGFEGEACLVSPGYTWAALMGDVYRLSEKRGKLIDAERLYVQTPTGPRPIRNLFTARINGEMAIVLDVDDVDPAEAFNALKQGVM